MIRLREIIPPLTAILFLTSHAPAADSDNRTTTPKPDWQWSVQVASVVSSETNDHPRAFLWIPPACRRLRGVVIGQHNMEEEQIFEHPVFRKALADLDFAVIWITPAIDLFFRFDRGSAGKFDEMLKALADESGYAELPLVPVVPLGHSAAASSPWNWAAWAPERILAAISVSGQWPYYKDVNTPDWGDRHVDGIPGLVTMGEFESAFSRAGEGLKQRADHPLTALSMLAEPGGGHFAATDGKISFISLYLRVAAKHRLPENWPVGEAPALKPIDPTRTGWLVDRGREDGKPTAPAAPLDRYTGNPRDAFWCFDETQAKATEIFQSRHAGKKTQFIGYVQKDGVVPLLKRHVRTALRFEPMDDGVTFRLGARLLDAAPADGAGYTQGASAEHAADDSLCVIDRICGPVEKLAPDRYRLCFYRMGMDNAKRSNSICFIARHPGDGVFRPAEMEAELKFPITNKEGADQTVRFEAPKDIPLGTRAISLNATSDSGMPVSFYVREGPAFIDGNTLRFTPIPQRAKYPVKVTVVAWQWGRSIDPKIKSATPVEHTMLITK
ncbi:MAG: hypothetical protein J0M04_02805 [Verrucomicrobia bacterium]|nr:hypothetical protein [Verrucomicrobiota bacterium]